MFEVFMAAIQQMIGTLLDRLSDTRAAKIDNLDAAISTRAPASSALSTATWTEAHADAISLSGARAAPLLSIGYKVGLAVPAVAVASLWGRAAEMAVPAGQNAWHTLVDLVGEGGFFGAILSPGSNVVGWQVRVTIDGQITTSAATTGNDRCVATTPCDAEFPDYTSGTWYPAPAQYPVYYRTGIKVEVYRPATTSASPKLYCAIAEGRA